MARGEVVMAALALAASTAWSAGTVHVAMKPEAVVASGAVRLDAIATVAADEDEATAAELGATAVATAPRVGYVERIGREELRNRLRALQPALSRGLVIEGEGTVVRTAATAIDGERLAEAALREIGPRAGGAAVRVVATPPDLTVARGSIEVRARPLEAGTALSRRMAIWVDVLVDGRPARSVPVAVEVDLRPAVARGESVALHASAAALRIQASATALGDAAVGETVWVKREGGEALRATVVGRGVVEVPLR